MEAKAIFLPTTILLNLALLAWWYFRVSDLMFIILVLVVLNLLLAGWLNKFRGHWWNFSFFPITFYLSSLAYSLIVSQVELMVIIIIFVWLGLIFYWRLVFAYLIKTDIYRPFSLEKFFSFFSFLTFFFLASAAYGLKTFIDLPTWQLLIGFVILEIIIIYQWWWINKMTWQVAWPYALVLLVVLVELFLTFNLLPINFNLSGFLIASSWHGLAFLSSENLSGQLTKTRSRFIIGLIIFIWLVVLLTTRWF